MIEVYKSESEKAKIPKTVVQQCIAISRIRHHGEGLFHFVYGASPQHILLHFPIKLLHLPIKFASFPQQIASFPQQFASFPQQIASFPQHSFSLPQHILCHFAKHRIKVFFCDLFSFLPFLAVPRQLYWWSEWWRDLTWPKKAMTKHNLAWYFFCGRFLYTILYSHTDCICLTSLLCTFKCIFKVTA